MSNAVDARCAGEASEKRGSTSTWLARGAGGFMILAALPLIWGGGVLAILGGSIYYCVAGIVLAASGLMILSGRVSGVWLYGGLFVATLFWSLWEVGLVFWPLVPRLFAPALLAMGVLLVAPGLVRGGPIMIPRRFAHPLAASLLLCLVAAAVFMVSPQMIKRSEAQRSMGHAAGEAVAPPMADEWRAYGRSSAGTRHAPFNQIDAGNVGSLAVAWTFRMGPTSVPPAHMPPAEQNTPLQVGDTLYVCNGLNVLFALDADNGALRWRFEPKASTPTYARCRGLGYHAEPDRDQLCSRRIIMTTIDARMMAFDARTGRPCRGFGRNGTVDTRDGIGDRRPGFYYHTSAPTVVGDTVILGGWVLDNQELGEPSGVIRAFDVRSGALVWAWDVEHPDRSGPPPAGENYSKNTPNMWGTPTFDKKLGLIYIPTGNRTPDFWGGGRSPAIDHHSASVVALDLATGRERWTFRTVYHDIWDYDVAGQPLLYDLKNGRGRLTPILIILTKRGQIFMLDRRSGRPVARVALRRVPSDTPLAGDWLSPVQPYSVDMPAIGAGPLREADMWGATPLDQLWCRIQFRRADYRGDFTPGAVGRSNLIYPGYMGGFNWGGGTLDERRGLLVVNDIRIPMLNTITPRAEADAQMRRAGRLLFTPDHVGLRPMFGTPFGVRQAMFMSPLGIPCNQPPWGTISAIDLRTRKLVWQIPAGTSRDSRIGGIKPGIPFRMGMPTMAAAITTGAGLVFYAGSQDYYLRALDVATGRELWKGRLPVGAQATPMTYVSPKSGKQYVALVAGGARMSSDVGDYVVAFALPARSEEGFGK